MAKKEAARQDKPGIGVLLDLGLPFVSLSKEDYANFRDLMRRLGIRPTSLEEASMRLPGAQRKDLQSNTERPVEETFGRTIRDALFADVRGKQVECYFAQPHHLDAGGDELAAFISCGYLEDRLPDRLNNGTMIRTIGSACDLPKVAFGRGAFTGIPSATPIRQHVDVILEDRVFETIMAAAPGMTSRS